MGVDGRSNYVVTLLYSERLTASIGNRTTCGSKICSGHRRPAINAATASDSANLNELVTRAVHRDEQAWAAIIERFGPLVAAVLRRDRLTHADVQETTQAVWLKLFENLHKLREPAALPGWIATTTQRQALQTIRRGARVRCVESIESVVDGLPCADQRTGPDDQLLQAERRRAVRDGLAELTAEQRELLLLVVADPPVSYREISERLKIPMGSIGPTRARHLRKLSETAAIRTYSDAIAS